MHLLQVSIVMIVFEVFLCGDGGDATMEELKTLESQATTPSESTEVKLESEIGIKCHQLQESTDTEVIEQRMGEAGKSTVEYETTTDGADAVLCPTNSNGGDKDIHEATTTESEGVTGEGDQEEEEEDGRKDEHQKTAEELLKEKVAEIEAKPVILTARV